MSKEIPLSQGKFAIVDDADYESLIKYKWTYGQGYAVRCIPIGRRGTKPMLRMHRVIMNTPKGMECDHINRNPLDNRRSNLRNCTHAENARNAKSHKGRSGFKGVWKNGSRWRAAVKVDGRGIHLGYFGTPQEAALAYNKAALIHYGEFARLNQID